MKVMVNQEILSKRIFIQDIINQNHEGIVEKRLMEGMCMLLPLNYHNSQGQSRTDGSSTKTPTKDTLETDMWKLFEKKQQLWKEVEANL